MLVGAQIFGIIVGLAMLSIVLLRYRRMRIGIIDSFLWIMISIAIMIFAIDPYFMGFSTNCHGGGYGYGGGRKDILLSVGVAVGTKVLVGEGGGFVVGITVGLEIGGGR